MTNLVAILILSMLAVMVCFTLVMSIYQKSMRNVGPAYRLFAVAILAWLLNDITYYAFNTEPAVNFLFNFKIPFVALTSVGELLLIMRFYRLDRYITRRLHAVLFAVCGLIFLMAVTSPWHGILRAEQHVLEMTPLHVMHNVRGVGFWLHAAFCYALTLCSAAILVVQHRKLPSAGRSASYVMLFAMLIIIASNAASIFFELPIDITAVGSGISALFVYVSIITSSRNDLLVIARDEIYNSLEESLFISDLSLQVQDANIAARRWLEQLGIPVAFPFPFTRIFQVLRQRGATIRENSETAAGTDIYYTNDDFGVVYNLRERFVYDRTDRPVGVYSTLLDVTRYKTLIDQLEKTAEIDPLTGLANRRVFDNLKSRYEAEETMPLGVILGDANGLKQVNDTLGHHQGDQLLRVLAQQLRQSCPAGATAARIGGDEFAILLPGGERADMAEVVTQIRAGLAEKAKLYEFTPSIALGAAERRLDEDGVPEPVETTVRRADENMYANKLNDRRSSRRMEARRREDQRVASHSVPGSE